MLTVDNNYCGDARKLLSRLPDGCVDLVVTSPPYDNLRKYDNEQGTTWNRGMFEEVAAGLLRVLKDGGVVVWIVNDKTEKGGKTLTSLRQAVYFQDIGFTVNDVMVWRKTNTMPTVRQPRYPDEFEYMFVLVKGTKAKTFNPIMISCKCAGQKYDSTAKKMGGEDGRRHISYNVNAEKVKGNVWDCAVAQNKTGHPAVYPQRLIEDHISSWSNAGDLVLDPFMGSGTTALASVKLGRHFLGFDISQDYTDMANRRVSEYKETLK